MSKPYTMATDDADEPRNSDPGDVYGIRYGSVSNVFPNVTGTWTPFTTTVTGGSWQHKPAVWRSVRRPSVRDRLRGAIAGWKRGW